MSNNSVGKIGIFDSGYGGLTVLKEIRKELPQYSYVYLGDNARAPYGTRSYDVVFQYTLECVEFLFSKGCEIVILACNTASAKALRTIQQKVMPVKYPDKKVLGVIRPSTELVGNLSNTKVVGILATEGTVKSDSYKIEIERFTPGVDVVQLACPLWVPIIEANEHDSKEGKAIFRKDIERLLSLNDKIDTIVLGCTHYPMIKEFVQEIVGENVQVISQGEIVAERLVDYFQRHVKLECKLIREESLVFYTSENRDVFQNYLQDTGWGKFKVYNI